MRLIDADLINHVIDLAEKKKPEDKQLLESFRNVINAVPTAAEIVSPEDTEE